MASAGGDRQSAAGNDNQLQQHHCDLFRCFCCWRRRCSPCIPRVVPGQDYMCISAAANDDDRPMWSVLVGCTAADVPSHNLRLHRFRVAGSGRVIGRSDDDLLEPFHAVSPDDDGRTSFDAALAALAPDGRRVYLVCLPWPALDDGSTGQAADDVRLPPKVFSMNIGDKSLSPLPPLPFSRGSFAAISAYGGLWVPAVWAETTMDCTFRWRLFVYRLVDGDDSWAEVNSVDFPYKLSFENPNYGGHLLQGYAVISDRFILLSFINSSFFCLDCATGALTRVVTVGGDSESGAHRRRYVPISGRGVHVQGDDDAIYFVRRNNLLAYKYSPEEGKPLAAPTEIETIWPYDEEEGYGFVVHLCGRMLCTVWVNMRMRCGCATRHALITTLTVRGGTDEHGCFVPNGVDILHSTCHRIDMLRKEAPGGRSYYDTSYDTFCFLQEYPDVGVRFDLSSMSSIMGAFNVAEVKKYPKILHCCRELLNGKPERIPGVLMLEDCKIDTRSDFYFVCQADQCSLVYRISTSGGKLATCHGNALEALLCLDTVGDIAEDDCPSWYFVHRGSMLHVIPSNPDCGHYIVDVEKKSYKLHKSKRSKLIFSAVFRAGEHIVALCENLQYVYILRNNLQWRRQKTTSSSIDLARKVKVSGFVDLVDDMFIVSDNNEGDSFLFDLKRGEWFTVEPGFGFLSGRCIFAEGFIYTCSDKCLLAFELIADNASYRLGLPIVLDFSWKHICGNWFLSFDSISRHQISGHIVFCLVQGYDLAPPSTSSHTLATTTVQVELVDTSAGKKKPVGIDHVDIALSSIIHERWILTNYAFSL